MLQYQKFLLLKFKGTKEANFSIIYCINFRSNALKNISQLNGFNGALAVSKDRETMGYAISVPALRSDHIKIGPLYAINRRIALLLLRQLCKAVKPESLVNFIILFR